MTDATVPLSVHPWPLSDDRMELLKQAKASLGLDYKILPKEPVYGAPGRVLCFGATPTAFLAKTAPIRPENVNDVASIAKALKFALEDDGDRFDEAWLLSVWAGCEITFSHSEDDTGKVAFR